ncbi:MAG: hypothetical protein FWC92_08310 [Defluviitaleaceae bacterium]|nr:hypothetical protein [Defluviitaleaceae bacterium]
MRVRVYDKDKALFFKSDVYAKINPGYFEKYLVLMPEAEGGCLKLYDYLDKSEGDSSLSVNINVINPEYPCEWIERENVNFSNTKIKPDETDEAIDKVEYYIGYKGILENERALLALLDGQTVHPTEFHLSPTKQEHKGDWNYVETKDDIDSLMKCFFGFHDSVIVSLDYVSGSGKQNEEIVVGDSMRKVSVKFDTCWCSSIELVFEGLLTLNLCPSRDNYSSEIDIASIFIKDEVVYFATGYVEDICSFSDDITWMSAFSLKWRFV